MKTLIVLALALIFNPLLYSQSCLPTGISLTAQSQVDQFPALYPGCIHILGNVTILGAGITQLDSLYTVAQVDGDLYLSNNENLQDINGLQNLERVGGAVRIQGNPLLENLDGLSNLRVLAGDYFYVSNNGQLKNMELNALDSIMGLVHIWSHDSLLDLDGFNNLHYLGQDLNIFMNPNLLSITGFASLAHISGALRLTDHPMLEDISAFDHPFVIDGALVITQNPQLGDCAVESVCNYLASPASFIAISGNASGCQSKEEVAGICISNTGPTEPHANLTIYPNPVQDALHLQVPLYPQGGIEIFSSLGILMAQYPEAPTTIDTGHWPKGAYWIRWQSANYKAEALRFIKQ